MNDHYFEYVGNLHIHSLFSDGAGTVPVIAQTAARAGLDFIILNDHDYMTDDLHLDNEGVYGEVLVLMGQEIGERYNHYLAYDLKEMVKDKALSPQDVIDRVNDQGGFGFLSHPFEKGMRFTGKSVAYTWNDLSVTGYTGLCIWNFASRWKERVKTPFHGLFFLLFKSQMLKGPSKRGLSFWDELCRKQKVVAVGGSDAHGSVFKWGPIRLKPLPYEYVLNSVNVHILLDRMLPTDFAGAKTQVYAALRKGRLFVAHDNLDPSRGFRFYYVSEGCDHLIMGQEMAFRPGTLSCEIPKQGEIRLLKDGAIQKRWRDEKASYRVEEAGVYRIEVYRHLLFFGWRPWIFSNPIYLR